MEILAMAAVLLSFLLFVGVVAVLVMVRRGGSALRPTREYDASRRDAVEILTGRTTDRVPNAQWYVPERRRAVTDDPREPVFRESVAEALRIAVPRDREPIFEADGTVRLTGEVLIVPAISTAELRGGGLPRDHRLVIGLVLVNPEPPGGDPSRVALPVQVLFPALERAGREDLVERFGRLADEVRQAAVLQR